MVESVKQQVSNIATTSVVKEAASSRRRPITIHGWIYDLETGELRDMDVSVQVPAVGPIYYGRLVDNLREHPHHSQPQSPISTYSSFYRPRGKKGKHDLVL